ncbi:MAG: winged helix DNA-binding domain-containing protein [Methanobacteriota archaeon]|nr:MAG: winged helix DNA-binding domain-containing protein [Euryarchaeota archaeon]
MVGAQAQLLSAAQMSLWTRTRGLRIEDVDRALWEDRTLAKVWCMRGSLHLIPSRDFAVFVRGSARREARSAAWLARAGVPMEAIERILAAIPDVLDQPLTRGELAARLSEVLRIKMQRRAGRGWGGPSDADGFDVGGRVLSVHGILFFACMRGLACFGPMRGKETTFVRPDRWLSGWHDLPQEAAETELLRRYLRAHGPASVTDFAQWTYLKAADAREIWGRLADALVPVDDGVRSGWLLRSDEPALHGATLESPHVRLLPFFDGFLLGLKDKGHLVDREHYKKVYRPQGWLAPAVLMDGRVAGIWSHERKGPTLSLRIESFSSLRPEARKRLSEEADDLRRFLGANELRFRLQARRPGSPRSTASVGASGFRGRSSRTSGADRG